LVFPDGAVGVEEGVDAGGAGDAGGLEGVAVELSGLIAGVGGDCADHSGISGDEKRETSRNFKVTIVTPRPLLGLGVPIESLKHAKGLLKIPGMRKGESRSFGKGGKDRDARRQEIALEGVDPAELTKEGKPMRSHGGIVGKRRG
jgi:hypothetical protein